MKASSKLDHEIDLRRFVHRQRATVSAMIALLDGSQSQFIDRSSKLVLHESTASKEDESIHSSSETMDDSKDWTQSQSFDTTKMVNRTNNVDTRLIKLLRLMRTRNSKTSSLTIPVKLMSYNKNRTKRAI